MGILIKIVKYREEQGAFFYKVFSLDGKRIVCYMKIDPQNNLLFFSSLEKFSKIIKTVNLSNEDQPIGSIPDIPQIVLIKAVFQALQATKKNEFPADISYYA